MALLRPLFPRQCLLPSSPPPHRPPGWYVGGRRSRKPTAQVGPWSASGVPLHTGLATSSLPQRPHPGPGCGAGSDEGCPEVHLRLGDGLLPHHALQPPCQVTAGSLALGSRGPPPDGQLLGSQVSPSARTPVHPRAQRQDPDPSFPRYWPVLDNALREAAFGQGVRVRLLVSCGLGTDPTMFPYLRSLQAISNPSAGISVDVVRLCSQGRGAALPALSSQPHPRPLSVPKESLHRACGESLQHPLQPGQPQQIHGHGEGSLHRWAAGTSGYCGGSQGV